MRRKTSVVAVIACALMVSSAWAGPAGMSLSKAVGVDSEAAIYDFQQANPHASLLKSGERIIQVYGRAFGFGDSPEETADQFRLDYAEMFGVQADELDPRGPLEDERHTQGVMYNRETGEYKFTLVYYTQYESGVPVFRADLRLLVRNEPGHSLVLAASGLRDLGTFSVNRVRPIDFDLARKSALEAVPDLINFTEPRRVIWAGVDDQVVEPAVGIEFIADNGREATGDYAKWLFITDARTGKILYQENQVLNVDVVGNVSGMASQDVGADFCVPEAVEEMRYARVEIVGGNSAFADENGDFVIPNGGDAEVTVRSGVRGEFFNVFNQGGPDTVLTQNVIPPGPANFIHNEANNQEFIRAEVNGYVEANVVRDAILVANPTYPSISTDQEFTVNVNINSTCNAFYDGSSINFFREGGGCGNTAQTDVVHHEYGHHLVATGGSGQGQYGEGMSDVLGVVLTDQSITGIGFFLGVCDSGIRDADNNKQFPCSGGIHDCGQLISGCVWDTRNELMITEPDTYTEMLFSLSVNSVLVHNGSNIGPDITIAWLTLDDDDNDIGNGNPHRFEICTGFGAHNMDCPELNLLAFIYPDGRPSFTSPTDATVFPVEIQSVIADLDEDSPMQHVSIDDGPFDSSPLAPILGGGGVLYEVSLPPADCFSTIDWYLSALTTDKDEVVDPSGAPSETYQALVVTSVVTVVDEDFENPVGYTVTGDANTGQWELAVPTSCGRGDPPSDFDGSGKCYVTEDQRPPSCDNDIDGGSTTLTSPIFDMSIPGDYFLSYARWYS
ncbi:MAG: hypothetical protein IID39_06795, partial [Planctomycetes bacterium]|nr:hypothetical protein [Planctomycetota bacterium]